MDHLVESAVSQTNWGVAGSERHQLFEKDKEF